jgi:glycosyltransferase involved in cell wall biosynthesis
MNIGIDAHMLGHNETGNETYILELVSALARRDGEDTFFVYVENPDILPPEIHAARHLRIVSYETRSRVRRLLRELPQRAAHNQLDVLHISYNAPPRLPAACALVVTIHDVSFEEHPEWFPWKLRAFLKWSVPRSARQAQQILTDTECAKNDLIRLYDIAPEKIQVTPYAADTRFRPIQDAGALQTLRAKYNTSDHFILAVGNMQPRKNWVRLMEAFARAKQQFALPHKLVIVGQRLWLADPVFDHARAFGDAIILTGYVPDADLPMLYNAADVFCYPSLYEGFGLPVLEAMACGTAVITSNVSSLPEVAGDAARLVNPYDVDEMAHALGETLSDLSYRQGLRERGQARAQLFSWTRTAQQTVEAYHRAARKGFHPAEMSKLPIEIRD